MIKLGGCIIDFGYDEDYILMNGFPFKYTTFNYYI